MVYELGVPTQPLAVGVTVIVAVTGVDPGLVAVKLGTFPVPLAAKPIVGSELVHANGVLEFHRIEFKAGYKCSEHEHQFKWNGFFVESGKMLVRVWQNGDNTGLVDETVLNAKLQDSSSGADC